MFAEVAFKESTNLEAGEEGAEEEGKGGVERVGGGVARAGMGAVVERWWGGFRILEEVGETEAPVRLSMETVWAESQERGRWLTLPSLDVFSLPPLAPPANSDILETVWDFGRPNPSFSFRSRFFPSLLFPPSLPPAFLPVDFINSSERTREVRDGGEKAGTEECDGKKGEEAGIAEEVGKEGEGEGEGNKEGEGVGVT